MSSPALRRGWIVVAALAACVLLANRLLVREEGPLAAPATTDRRVVELALADDSTEAAEAAHERCDDAPDRIDCYEELLVAVTREGGPRPAMTTLSRIGDRDQDARRDGHVLAHAVGITAYLASRDVGPTFAACTEIFQSGCYHGVIQAYFEDVPRVGAAEVNAVCADYTRPDADWWLRFQCVHGMGHGLTMFHDHHLVKALRGCDLLADPWDQDACYGGAFMENIVNATHPHHPAAELEVGSASDEGAAADPRAHGGAQPAAAAGGEGADPHAGHGPAGADAAAPAAAAPSDPHAGHGSGAADGAAAERFQALDPDDPHYPCSILQRRYLVACYQMQTSVMLHFNGGDVADAARSCDGAPEGLRYACYQSLGRDVSSYTAQDHAESVRLCSLGNPRWQPWCYVGVVKNFVDLTARSEDGMAFCRVVPEGPNRLLCYVAVGEEIAVLENGRVGRERLCEAAGGEPYRTACRYGARTVDRPPPGMPVAG